MGYSVPDTIGFLERTTMTQREVVLGLSRRNGVAKNRSPSTLRPPARAQGLIAGTLLAACVFLTPAVVAGTYYPPPESKGGWRTLVTKNAVPTADQKSAVLTTTGLDTDQLVDAWHYVESLGQQQSLLVIRHGWVVAEWELRRHRARQLIHRIADRPGAGQAVRVE